VLTVMATDADVGNNGSLIYSLRDVPRYDGLAMFTIDPRNGLITTVQSDVLDREITAEYQLTVVATDRGSPRMSGASSAFRLVLSFVFLLQSEWMSPVADSKGEGNGGGGRPLLAQIFLKPPFTT